MDASGGCQPSKRLSASSRPGRIKEIFGAAKLLIETYWKSVIEAESRRMEIFKLLLERDIAKGETYEESMGKYHGGCWPMPSAK